MAKHIKCSFCKKENHEVAHMIQDRFAAICDECVLLCIEILAEKTFAKDSSSAVRAELRWPHGSIGEETEEI